MTAHQLYGPVFLVKGLAYDGPSGELFEVAFKFKDCYRCGAAVSDEMWDLHEEWHVTHVAESG